MVGMVKRFLDYILRRKDLFPTEKYLRLQDYGARILHSTKDPAGLSKVEKRVRGELQLFYRWSDDRKDIWQAVREEIKALEKVPRLAFVFMFHGDGRVRQQALRKLQGPLPTSANVYGLFWRLNDWVPQVNQEAYDAFERVMPATPAKVIAPALLAVLPHLNSWGRWSRKGPEAVRKILHRPDVSAVLLDTLKESRQSNLGILFRELSKDSWIDPYIIDMFRAAPLPHIRAMALEMMISQKARWPTGEVARIWIDRSMGEYRTEPVFQQRDLSVTEDPIKLLRAGAMDRSAIVRRYAADGVIALRDRMDLRDDLETIALILDNDPNIGVRNRINFFRRKRHEMPG